MRSLALRHAASSCCGLQQRGLRLWWPPLPAASVAPAAARASHSRQLQAQASAQQQAAAGSHDQVGAGKRLYVLDLMPLVYRFLKQAPAPAPPAAAAMQQQPLGTPSDPAAAELLRAAQAAAVAQAELASTPAAEFLGLLIGIINRPQEPPTHLAVVVDVPGATYRRLKYPQYKSQRPEHPPQLTAELSAALSVVDALSIPVLAVPGVEADDVIGTLASKAAGAGFEVVIVSTDKDFYQLLGPRVSVLSRPPRGPLYRPSDFQQQYGLPDPRLIIDLKALAGDPADNIPGVRGVGDKSARALVGAWGPLEGIFGALDDLGREQSQAVVKLRKPALEMLHSAEGRAAARFAKQLVTINTALKAPPLREPWESYELRLPPDGGALAQERALKLRMGWVCARLHDLLQRWAATGSSSSSSNGRSVQQAPGVVR